MVRVPEYQGGVSLRAKGQARVNVQANGSTFGADVGRGMQGLGQGMGQFANALDVVSQFDDELKARDRDNGLASAIRELSLGEGGYLTLQGQAAVEQRDAFEKSISDLRAQYGEGLSGRAAQAYDRAAEARIQAAMGQGISHQASARRQWFAENSDARLENAANDALSQYGNADAVNAQISLGRSELVTRAGIEGWSAEKLESETTDYVSGVQYNVATRLLANDPMQAQAYYEAHKDEFNGAQQFQFEEQARVPLMNARVQSNATAFFGGTGPATNNSRWGDSSHPTSIIGTESGGNFQARNNEVGAGGVRGHYGRVQFGVARFSEARAAGAVPAGMSIEQFLRSPDVQIEAENWHWADINRHIADNNLTQYVGQRIGGVEVTVDGIRAMAHLGGKNGATRFLRTGGKYNPADSLGTSLQDYLKRHAGTTVPTGQSGPLADYQNLEAYLSTIDNPVERDQTRATIMARQGAEAQAISAQRTAYQQQAFELIETRGVSPAQFPPEMAAAIGQDGMSSLYNYWETRASGRAVQTDLDTLGNLQLLAADQPEAFASFNLQDVRDQLSDADYRTVSKMQADVFAAQRGEREAPIDIGAAMRQAEASMSLVGLTAQGLKGSAAEAMNARLVQMRQQMIMEMERFREVNSKPPSQMDIEEIVNKLLLPVVLTDNNRFGYSIGANQTDAFMFEVGDVGTMPDGTTVELSVDYDDIPTYERADLERSLSARLGRAPSPVEVEAEYEWYLKTTYGLDIGTGQPEVMADGPAAIVDGVGMAPDVDAEAPRSEGTYVDTMPPQIPIPMSGFDAPPTIETESRGEDYEAGKIGRDIQAAVQSANLGAATNNTVANAINRIRRDDLTEAERDQIYDILLGIVQQLPEGEEKLRMRRDLVSRRYPQ